MVSLVLIAIAARGESLVAHGARERLFASVTSQMLLEIRLQLERLPALLALEGQVCGVGDLVLFRVAPRGKALLAELALVRFLSGM